MKVVYSVQVSLGKGFGYTAQQQVEALSNNLVLYKIITPEIIGNFSDDFEFDKKASELLSKVDIKEEQLAEKLKQASYMTELVGDIFIGWGNACLEQLKEAKSLGMKTIVNRASTHIEFQEKILVAEGLKLDPESVKRQLEEYELADKILVPCNFIKETFPEKLRYKVKIIPFGVDLEKFNYKPKNTTDKYIVLSVMNNPVRKGLKYLLSAWEQLKLVNAELRIIGCEPPVDYKIPSDVTFIRYVPDIIKEYQNASVFCLPSLEEGQALVISEAMACGTPVIITNHCGYNDIIMESSGYDGKEGEIIGIRNIKELMGNIYHYYIYRNELKEMGKEARKTIEKYPWSKFQYKFIKFLKEI